MAETNRAATIGRGKGKRNSPLQRILGQPAAPVAGAEENFVQRVIGPLGERLTGQGSVLMKNVNLDEIRFRLLRAGFPLDLRARDFMTIKIVLTFALGLVFFAMPAALNSVFGLDLAAAAGPPLDALVRLLFPFFCAAVGALYGFKLPDIWLAIKTRKRQFDIQMVMPDMIDLITVSVEAGLGLSAAIQRVSSRFPNPLSEEFLRTMQEMQLGRSHPEALRDLSHRIDIQDLTTLVVALVQAEVLGISMGNVLRVQSQSLREKRSQRAREQAQKAPIKMIFPLVLLIFPTLFIVILGPVAIQFMRHSNNF